ncbi:MAG: c-type cytochrome [Chloroflexi bacterium]|nr:c-type cytochrome [Chloroflexota bacterium]
MSRHVGVGGVNVRRVQAYGILLAATSLFVAGSACIPAPPSPPATPRPPTGGPPVTKLTPAPTVPGDPEHGRQLISTKQCPTCHTVQGVQGATGTLGPNLTNVALRPTLAGDTIQNSPSNMARWIMDAPSEKQGTAMPSMQQMAGLTDQEARDIVAFLYSQPYNPRR